MAWCRKGGKPLPEPMISHKCLYVALGGDEFSYVCTYRKLLGLDGMPSFMYKQGDILSEIWSPITLKHSTLYLSNINSTLYLSNIKIVWPSALWYKSRIILTWFLYPRNEVRGGILDSPCLSVCLSVCPSVRLSVCLSVCLSVILSCPPCSIYSSGWNLSIFGTNDQ